MYEQTFKELETTDPIIGTPPPLDRVVSILTTRYYKELINSKGQARLRVSYAHHCYNPGTANLMLFQTFHCSEPPLSAFLGSDVLKRPNCDHNCSCHFY